ncbi:hypothetical protein EXIGLDRAFT_143693 [Exidia glandulosa HHB12029]|uniref:Uncharacterized protein n=1 Tax=Exidia glandulosa HHB12029 TaxID=1314781 RepID=A0A165NBU8_EXIGL|nr:hypothetical protein EXIGLDRAFT_143693 [Exidia glandulosa HHB12029]
MRSTIHVLVHFVALPDSVCTVRQHHSRAVVFRGKESYHRPQHFCGDKCHWELSWSPESRGFMSVSVREPESASLHGVVRLVELVDLQDGKCHENT